MLIHKLTQLGIQMNVKKSIVEASQQVVFVGHQFNLQTNCVTPTNKKQAQTMLRIKHQEKGQCFQPSALAGLAGNLKDAMKSNVALQGFPQQVMRHAAQGVHKNCTSMGHWQKYKCWLQTVKKMPSLIKLLQQCKNAISNPIPRIFRASNNTKYIFRLDASNIVLEWTTAKWWVTLQTMIYPRHPPQRYVHQSIFTSPEGAIMPSPRWAILFFGGAGMTTLTQLRNHLRMLECQQDIRPRTRIQWREEAHCQCTNPSFILHIKQAIRRIKKSGAGCKYPAFYNIEPLVHRAFQSIVLTHMSTESLLDRLLLQVRLTTLMRSVDAANICWGLRKNRPSSDL